MNGCHCGGGGTNVDEDLSKETCYCSNGYEYDDEASECFEQPETRSNYPRHSPYRASVQQEMHSLEPTGGCGRPNCPRIVYTPKVEWQCANDDKNDHGWPSMIIEKDDLNYENYCFVDDQAPKNYRTNDDYEGFEDEEISETNNYSPYERVGGGCDQISITNNSRFSYYANEFMNQQNDCTELKEGQHSEWCERCSGRRCCQSHEPEVNHRERKRVHF